LHQIPPRIVLHVIFWLGKLAIEETIDNDKTYVQSNFKGAFRAPHTWWNMGYQY
jgi:hypothetical protein